MNLGGNVDNKRDDFLKDVVSDNDLLKTGEEEDEYVKVEELFDNVNTNTTNPYLLILYGLIIAFIVFLILFFVLRFFLIFQFFKLLLEFFKNIARMY